ncbi:phytoene/squalene synthase family protein [Massilia sp. YIM B02769]|uniref:15-cis-phytoene synthase CrtB n=1 Tax=Massilia sp. YIM B02769 TaxID=3050129 RepID=UPI0025B662B6|nr:15-cis-phytoene synthase CrtB [Massilia sp. YIM B02769]MDN4057482.1 phytoene/squalene synthase family protein [Massilia sp. YIM B02769]
MSEALMQHATQTIEVGSKSFAAAAKLFDAETRRGVLMLYAWCRHCDDVVDGQELGFVPAASAPAPHDAARELALLRDQTRRAYAGEAMRDPAFAAFQEVALKHGIEPRYAYDHLAGFAMDVEQARYETIEDTLRYCYHVAGVVGLMMASIMGTRDPAVLDRACDLGLAFQLTNIGRDIVDDAQIGRCYLPAAWLREAGIPQDEIALPRHRAALAKVAARLVDHAEPYYDSACAGLAALPLRSAWAIATARLVYRQIGIVVKRRGPHAWDERAGTGKLTKLWLLLRGGLDALSSRIRTTMTPRPARLWSRPAADSAVAVAPAGGAAGGRHAVRATAV